MKRLLLIPAIVGLAMILYACNRTPHVPLSTAEVIEQAHEAFPVPDAPSGAPCFGQRVDERTYTAWPECRAPQVQTPQAPKKRVVPKAKRHLQVKPKQPPVVLPAPQYEETLPQELGCIFPFSLIPTCYPGPNF
jgi:hypothetical protein